MASVQEWIEKHLRLQVNATKSGAGRVWERKFLGFRLNRAMQIEAAPGSLERGGSTYEAGGGTTDWPRTADRLPAGGMDTAPHPGMLLAEVAPPGRARAAAAQPGVAGTHAERGAEFPGGLASGGDRQPAKARSGTRLCADMAFSCHLADS